jgi:hypothetical protein
MRNQAARRLRLLPLAGWLATLALALWLGGAGCADGKLSGESDVAEDTPADHLDGDAAADPGVDPTADPLADPRSDPDAPELAGECEPFSVACTEDGLAIQRCSAEGALFAPFQCDFEHVCEENAEEAACVPCEVDVNCPEEEPECEPNVPFCLDFQTAAQCTADGRIGVTSGCGLGRCFGGGCNSTGNGTGEICGDDTGCRGRRCLCGGNDTANASTALCAGDLAPGYCTTGSCDENGCHPDSEVCADFALSGAHGGGRYCLLRELCGTRLTACRAGARGDGHVCRELPVTDRDGGRSWALGCWVPPPASPLQACADANCLAPIGGACNSNTDCIGGQCLRPAGSSGPSYCAAPCSESQGCPSYAACVRLDSAGDNHYCLAKAHEADCPRIAADFEIVSRSMPRLGGVGTAQVCWVRP